MSMNASITAPDLIEALVANDIMNETRLVSLLGEARHGVTLNRLEMSLVRENVISVQRLLMLKGAVAGLPVFDPATMKPMPTLSRDLAKSTGALALALPRPSIAMVEDLPMNVDAVARALGIPDFDIYLITAPQFAELLGVLYSEDVIDPRPACVDVFEIFDEAVRQRATDIHVAVGAPPGLRIDGRLERMTRQPIDTEWLRAEIGKIAQPRHLAEYKERHQADFAYTFGSSRFRINIYEDRFGPALAARKLSATLPTCEQLKLPQSVRAFAELERGLVLVTGPTGSGKSTTLAALLNEINSYHSRHLLTLEDPIEYYLPTDGRSVVNQRELGEHFLTFPDALRAALRQDPDVILVGELRDLETVRTALQAAETGHLVYGTLHTYDAAATVARVVSMFPPDEQDQVRNQLAYLLKGVVSQTLLPLANAQGRVAAYEVMVSTSAIRNNLRKQDGNTQLKQTIETGFRDGMQTMEMSLADLCRRKVVRESEAEYRAQSVEDFQRLLNSPSTAGQ